jgi:transposase
MLRMDQVHVIRHKVLIEGCSRRSVAREMGVSRNTVRKYLREAAPRRVEAQSRARPVLERVAPRLEELLEAWSRRTTRKQRITATRLYRQLREEGFSVGVTTVREWLREWRRERAEVYVPLVHRAGDEGQADFFEVTVEEGGIWRKAWKFLLRLPFSGRDFVWIYDRCDQLSFLDGHARAFVHFGGVPERIVYDRLSAALKRRMGLVPELTDRFRALVSHYLFEPCFARPGEGHDKGSVEARGKGIRLQHLTPVPRGESLCQISAAVVAEVDRLWSQRRREDGTRCGELWAEESARLAPLPAVPFEVRRLALVSVSRQAMVVLEGARYSVPSHWKSLEAEAWIGVDDVRLVCRGEEEILARQRRGGRHVQYRHYLTELAKKPQAVRQVAPELVAELGEPYGRLWQLLGERYGALEGARVLAKILGAVADHGPAPVATALGEALATGRFDLLALRRCAAAPAEVEVPERLAAYEIDTARAADFDTLLSEGAS